MHVEIAIIGAGFSGIGMAIELLKHGITSFRIFESASAIGGTWRDNTYPGCACDVPSHVYSYSFAPNPNWTRAYSHQPEILAYMEDVVEQFKILPYVTFDTPIKSAAFDEDSGTWTLKTNAEPITCTTLILAMGGLSRPMIPKLKGLEDFQGPTWHSARWNHEIDLRGKRVACIGTGASAVQFVPPVAEVADSLDIYQRTPPWVVPRPDRTYKPIEISIFHKVPAARSLYRSGLYTLSEIRGSGFVTDSRILKVFQKFAEHHIRKELRDHPDLLKKVLPDYTIGCKRILMSDDYYPALKQANVDVITAPILEVTPTGITADTHREYDVILFGTGFHVTDFMDHFPVWGLGSQSLNEAWKDGAEAYYGITVSGFPNLFFLVGPNTGLGHNSIISMIEAQTAVIRKTLERIRASNARWVDTDPQMQRAHNDAIQRRLRRSVWQSGCKSWYQQQDGKITTLWPKYTWQYHLETQKLPDDAFVFVP